MSSEIVRRCRYTTDRLRVEEWHHLAERSGSDLVEVVGRVLTPSTTAALPPDWQGDFDRARAERWIETRDAESPTLLVSDRTSGDAVGLVILFEMISEAAAQAVDVRLGYVLAESWWGRGLATELVEGLVRWAMSEPAVRSLSGGVAHDNPASARVLVKCGFSPTEEASEEQVYRLDLR